MTQTNHLQKLHSNTDFGPDSGGRMKGLLIIKPIVYGNFARYFGRKREEDGHTHEWTVYVKPYENEDMSAYVKKVHFKLHESYANQNRILTKPPYEVTESGWGEFEIIIKIFFHDPNERPVTIYHILKLFQTGSHSSTSGDTQKPLVSEFYDELLFQDPSVLMEQLLTSRSITMGQPSHDTNFATKKTETEKTLKEAQDKVTTEIKDLRDKISLARTTLDTFRDAIAKAQAMQAT